MNPPLRTKPPSNAEQEAALESYFRTRVRRAGGRAVKVAPVEKGCPDRLVLLPGGIVRLVELKTNKGMLAPAQRVWHERAAAIGHKVEVLHGKDGVDAWLEAFFATLGPKDRRRRRQARS